MIGGGFFICSRDESVYMVGAYDRSYFDKPVGHVIQFHAIKEMQNRGLVWYNIGERIFANDEPAPSVKEISISKFKSGFSTHVFPTYLLTHIVDV
jgi:lipid II:glycine glycyltransferase (peptidoglycan interpeptide bridge formation enzyme)